MENAFVLDSKTDALAQDKPKVEKMSKNPIANTGRKTLAEVSNRPRISCTLTRDNKSLPNSLTVKDYIEQLQKDNAAFMKLLADKKIIDISGAELQTLRTTLQKMQQQNLLLAQSNSRMLADLNSGKDRLKDLQHQLGCRNGLLIAKKLELEGKRKTKTCETTTDGVKKVKVSEHEEMEVCKVAERNKDQRFNTNGRQKSKSLGPSAQKVQEKGVGDSGRLQARRQSARFKHDERKPVEGLCQTTDAMDDKMQEDEVAFSVKKDENTRRSSISRPSREVAKKVQSYREPSLILKMRRPE